ncbi:MAG TPA: class I SAM-dependent methyltransferase [Longimicrobiaceae bacterium]|nr:class I SAM-dependent methyltransferase [Longimicrobiaceae bacterium]
MPRAAPAPNRLLDLDELRAADYRSVLEEMDALVAQEGVSYLHPGKRWEYPWALERADLEPGSRVLDAGSGDSIFPIYLARHGYRVTAVDLAFSGTLDALHGVDVDYVRADLTSLPQPDESFDAVFCISVIEHLPEGRIPFAMQQMRRVLKPGGRLLLTTDYYRDAEEEVWYEGPDRRFRVDWGFFDEARLRRLILGAPGFRLEGELDLAVDWETTSARMREYHGYPYTSVGVALVKE